MSRAARNTLIGILGLILIAAPMLVRSSFFGNRDSYEPPAIDTHLNAATPIPTVTALPQLLPAAATQQELRSGPVIVDLAHFNFLDITKFQPLSSALAQRGLGTRFWLPIGIDAMEITSFLDFPDQSEKLAAQLEDASGLIIVSPYFLWSPEEIEVVTSFVADGGRLLIISDPDISGDSAQMMNLLAEPYGVVFNDDYLYNTDRNDENFTYTFQGDFLDRAADLEGSEIVFYGARSISGSVEEQVRSSDTTLSSSRTGLTSFTTVAIGGLSATETADRVLAMSDFDVLSEPFVDRYDNMRMLDFVADFLAGGGRTETLADFPGAMGKEVALVYGTRDTIDAELITVSAKLQQRLARSGRDMQLAQSAPLSDGQIISSTQLLTGPLSALVYDNIADAVDEFLRTESETEESATEDAADEDAADEDEADEDEADEDEADEDEADEDEADEDNNVENEASLTTTLPATPTITPTAVEDIPQPLPEGNVIYLADFETAGEQESLLSDAGFTLVHIARTPTPTPTFTPTFTPTPSPTSSPTPSPTPTVPGLTPTAAPIDATDGLTSTAPITGTNGITGTAPITGTGSITESLGISATVDSAASLPAEIGQTDAITTAASITQTEALTIADSTAMISTTVSITGTQSITNTNTVTESEEPEPIITAYLVSDSGLQLLAAETVLIVQLDRPNEDKLVAVLGESAAAINAGVERLLERNFADCVIEDDQAICPFVGKSSGESSGSNSASNGNSSNGDSSADSGSADSADSSTPTPTPTADGESDDLDDTPTDAPTTEPTIQPITPADAKIMIVDDNDDAADGESSEAQFYLSTLSALGTNPQIWNVAENGTPPSDELIDNDWVIWSSGNYANGGPTVADLDPLFEVLNGGGRITISSQNTFFGQTQDPPSQLVDVQITSDMPTLTNGLPDSPIALTNGGALVAPIQANTEENPSLSVVIRRGASSDDAEEPILFTLVDDEVEEATGARLLVLGMSIEWLPAEVSSQLIENMLTWVLE